MAHHLAELMVSAKKASSTSAKRTIEAEVCDLIIKLWTHRAEFQHYINPLAPLAPLLSVIRTLEVDNPSWIPRHLSGEARSLYDVFRRLMIAAILGKAQTNGETELKQARKTAKFQSTDEKELIAGLGIWSDALSPKPKIRVKIVYGDDEAEADEGEKSIEQVIKETIADARTVLDKFEEELVRPRSAESLKPKAAAKKERHS